MSLHIKEGHPPTLEKTSKTEKKIITHWLKEASPFVKQLQNNEDKKREAYLKSTFKKYL